MGHHLTIFFHLSSPGSWICLAVAQFRCAPLKFVALSWIYKDPSRSHSRPWNGTQADASKGVIRGFLIHHANTTKGVIQGSPFITLCLGSIEMASIVFTSLKWNGSQRFQESISRWFLLLAKISQIVVIISPTSPCWRWSSRLSVLLGFNNEWGPTGGFGEHGNKSIYFRETRE